MLAGTQKKPSHQILAPLILNAYSIYSSMIYNMHVSNARWDRGYEGLRSSSTSFFWNWKSKKKKNKKVAPNRVTDLGHHYS